MTQRKILVFVLLLSAFAISFAILTFDVLGEEKVPELSRRLPHRAGQERESSGRASSRGPTRPPAR